MSEVRLRVLAISNILKVGSKFLLFFFFGIYMEEVKVCRGKLQEDT